MKLDPWFIIEGHHDFKLDYIFKSNLTKLSQWRQSNPAIEISFRYDKEKFLFHSYIVSEYCNDYEGDHT